MNIIEAYKIVEGFVPFNESAVTYEAMQTLKAVVLAQQSTNSAMVQLLCDVKGLLLNNDTPSREARAEIIGAINAVLAQ
jgi:hypothetical protein